MCCERCPGATLANTRHIARRRLLKAAVFQPQQDATGLAPARPGSADHDAGTRRAKILQSSLTLQASAATPAPAKLYRTVTGRIIDVSPQVIAIGDDGGERRFALTAGATAIGRVTGRIVDCDSASMLVDEGATKGQRKVVIPTNASDRIQVRFPNLRPGYLIDIIGIRRRDYLEGMIPVSPQPPYRSDRVVPDRAGAGRLSEAIGGSAIWHDSADEPYGVLGVSYPAIDPAAGCAEDSAADVVPGQAPAFRQLPYLAVGTALNVRNECTGIAWTLPVTGCAPMTRLFNDRCVACANSPRGRIADLTVASFVALGGCLEDGCFSATLTIGR